MCTSTKTYVLIAITLLAACTYIALEKPCCTEKDMYGTVAQVETETGLKREQDVEIEQLHEKEDLWEMLKLWYLRNLWNEARLINMGSGGSHLPIRCQTTTWTNTDLLLK